MKEEKIIELLEGLGKQIHRRDGDWIVEMNSVCHVDSQGIIELISAVEQETLERAEKVCEDYANFSATTMDALFAANYIASKIYKLKDSHKV